MTKAEATVVAMPELPEVETIRRQLEPQLAGATIIGADSHPSAKFTPARETPGAKITGIGRRGKYLLFDLEDFELVAHLGMTGSFSVMDQAGEGPLGEASIAIGPHVRAVWQLSEGQLLIFRDIRRFGRLHLVPKGDYRGIATLRQMGPEPLTDEFTGPSLYHALRKSSRPVKTQLLSQRPVAGVGNIYADEALFRARINPRARNVGRARAHELADAIKVVLAAGIANGGTTLRDYVNAEGESGQNQHELLAYGRGGEPCTNCGESLRKIMLDARATTYCPNCQRR